MTQVETKTIREQIHEARQTIKELAEIQHKDKSLLRQDHRKVKNAWSIQSNVHYRKRHITELLLKYHSLKRTPLEKVWRSFPVMMSSAE